MRVAVVTGGNKGIGFAIVKGLCQNFDGIVYLTARDVNRGKAAVAKLEKLGLKPCFYQLDISNDVSVNAFKDFLEKTYHGLDVLVNNAAIKDDTMEPFSFQAEETLRINYFSLRRVCIALYPLLKPHARIVNVSSSSGHLSRIPGESLKKRLVDPNLTEEGLDDIMNSFINTAKANNHLEAGWPKTAYIASKVGVSALTRIQQKAFDKDPNQDIVVNAVHPGYVATDMTKNKGNFTLDRGAEAPLYLALLPKNTDIKGKYVWHDKSIIDWVNEPLPA